MVKGLEISHSQFNILLLLMKILASHLACGTIKQVREIFTERLSIIGLNVKKFSAKWSYCLEIPHSQFNILPLL